MKIIRHFAPDWALTKLLRGATRETTICRRKSDGTLWAASSPQRLDYAMRGLGGGKASFHFVRVRVWRGIPIVSPKLMWRFSDYGQFEIVQEDRAFWLPCWSVAKECELIDAGARG